MLTNIKRAVKVSLTLKTSLIHSHCVKFCVFFNIDLLIRVWLFSILIFCLILFGLVWFSHRKYLKILRSKLFYFSLDNNFDSHFLSYFLLDIWIIKLKIMIKIFYKFVWLLGYQFSNVIWAYLFIIMKEIVFKSLKIENFS